LEGPIASSLLDTYAYCGNMESLRKTFNYVKKRDLILWTSIINVNGFTLENSGKYVLISNIFATDGRWKME